MRNIKKWGKSEIIGAVIIALAIYWAIFIAHSLLVLPIVIIVIVLVILFLFAGKEST